MAFLLFFFKSFCIRILPVCRCPYRSHKDGHSQNNTPCVNLLFLLEGEHFFLRCWRANFSLSAVGSEHFSFHFQRASFSFSASGWANFFPMLREGEPFFAAGAAERTFFCCWCRRANFFSLSSPAQAQNPKFAPQQCHRLIDCGRDRGEATICSWICGTGIIRIRCTTRT